ncbi:MAG TPA: hypothetical protein DF698_06995 [Candidatus Atribacteria bacterium]|nr:hypothetical protein [Candidatus Atribacteria bacterium]
MNQVLLVCGLVYNECEYFKTKCQGCYAVQGSTFWAKEMPGKICPLYQCAINDNQLSSCGQCSQLPCKTFTEFKDPNLSDEQNEKSLIERVTRLKN